VSETVKLTLKVCRGGEWSELGPVILPEAIERVEEYRKEGAYVEVYSGEERIARLSPRSERGLLRKAEAGSAAWAFIILAALLVGLIAGMTGYLSATSALLNGPLTFGDFGGPR